MTPLAPHEQAASLYAGSQAAEYLSEIGKFDLQTLTPDEWQIFCHTFSHNFLTKRAETEPCPF